MILRNKYFHPKMVLFREISQWQLTTVEFAVVGVLMLNFG